MTQFTKQLQRSPNSCWLAKKGLGLQKRDNVMLLILPVGSKLTGSNYTGATNKTAHKTVPQDNLPESLPTPTQVRFVSPRLLLTMPPSQILPQPPYPSGRSIDIFKDAKRSGFTYGIISWLLRLAKKAETSAGWRSGAGKAV